MGVEKWVREVVIEDVIDMLQETLGLKKGPKPPNPPSVILQTSESLKSALTLEQSVSMRPGMILLEVIISVESAVAGDVASNLWRECERLGLKLVYQPNGNREILIKVFGQFERVSGRKMTFPEAPTTPSRSLTEKEVRGIRDNVIEMGPSLKVPATARIRPKRQVVRHQDELQKKGGRR